LGRRAAADLRAGDAVFFVVFFIVLATAPLRTGLFLPEVFATFFETLFFFAVFFATPHLLKLRGEGTEGMRACTGTILHGALARRIVARPDEGP
jgi:hypothetical protein